jgi:hypothetical protein
MKLFFSMKSGGPPRLGVWDSGVMGNRKTDSNFYLNPLNASLAYFNYCNWGEAPGFKGRMIDAPPRVVG